MKKILLLMVFFLAVPCRGGEIDTDIDDNDALDIAYGGTNATTASAARTNLDFAWDNILNPDAADEIDFGSYVIELNVADFRVGDGGDNYVRFWDDSGTIKMSFAGNAGLYGGTITVTNDGAIQTGTTATNWFTLDAYDNDTGPAYVPLLKLIAGNTPELQILEDVSIGAAGVKISDDGDGAITLLGLGDGYDEAVTINLDDTENTAVISSSTGVATVDLSAISIVTTGEIKGRIAGGTSTGGALPVNEMTIATAAGDYDLPDACDSATFNWACVYVRDVSETVSLTVSASEDTIVYKGLSLGANDELDSPGAAQDSVCVVCLEANLWYVTSNSGDWTDGGTAD